MGEWLRECYGFIVFFFFFFFFKRPWSVLTLEVLGTADELHAGEDRDATGQEHGEAAHLHATLLASGCSSLVPPHEWPAAGGVVDVVEEAALGNQQGVRLEWSF